MDQDVNNIKRGLTGMAAWLMVRGQIFLEEEAVEAADFSDLMESYGIESNGLVEFIGEDGLTTGHRLYMTENLPVDELGAIILSEKDQRIIKVAQERKREHK